MAKKLTVGSTYTIAAGTRVNWNGIRILQMRTRVVTIRNIEQATGGKTRITWKSLGYPTSTLV